MVQCFRFVCEREPLKLENFIWTLTAVCSPVVWVYSALEQLQNRENKNETWETFLFHVTHRVFFTRPWHNFPLSKWCLHYPRMQESFYMQKGVANWLWCVIDVFLLSTLWLFSLILFWYFVFLDPWRNVVLLYSVLVPRPVINLSSSPIKTTLNSEQNSDGLICA